MQPQLAEAGAELNQAPATVGAHSAGLKLLKKGVPGAFIVQVAGAGFGLVTHFVVARLIGQAEYGIFALALSWISVLSVVAQMGQDVSVVRFLPGYCLRGEWGKARGLRLGVGTLVFCASILIGLVGCLVVYGQHAKHETAWSLTFYIAFATMPVLTQLQQSGALHRAFKRAVSSGIYVNVVRPAVFFVLLGCMALAAREALNAAGAMLASALAALIALVVSAWHLSRIWPAPSRKVKPEYELRTWTHVGAHLSLLSIVMVAGNRLDVLVLGALTGTAQVGAYYAAAQIAGFALYGLQATNVVLAPLIAERFDADDLRGLQLIARRAARLGFVGAVLASLFFVVAGRWVLGLFGADFVSAYVPMLVLLLAYCIVTAMGEVGFMLSMTKYQKHATFFILIGIALNCVSSYFLVPMLGALGAAVGSALSIIAWRFLALRFVIQNLGVNPAIIGRIVTTRPRK
ncbi:lipopolysaccharide biosynthesis protein [Dyella sedimenti]|uniref:lipopolysaccharide biosynthesis protein n=1 Tax=Dyella sedimenti TaxID=2919947 RepID=UPI001FA97C55|nr:oligosaccharide flippase family protein [Dyella sedimenti]